MVFMRLSVVKSASLRWLFGLVVIWPADRVMAQEPTTATSSDSRGTPGDTTAMAPVYLDLRGSALRNAVRESIRSPSLLGQSTTSTAGSGPWKWFRWVLLGGALFTATFFYLLSKT